MLESGNEAVLESGNEAVLESGNENRVGWGMRPGRPQNETR